MAARMTPEEIKRRNDESNAKALANFAFERVEVPGERAMATWEQLKSAGRGVPVVIGDDDSFGNLLVPFGPAWPNQRLAAEIIAAADGIRHPESLAAYKAREEAKAEYLTQSFKSRPDAPLPTIIVTDAGGTRELTREETQAFMLQESRSPPLGDWPAQAESASELSVALDRRSGGFLRKAHIALIPTDDWTTIPAYLRWGGWNACPHPEYHVAALRSWRDRFGAELVGLSHDTMNLRVAHPPASREDALDLAREQYVYCPDNVDQGVGTLSAFAAYLMGNTWWDFWWD
jgi:hypothetical protein